MKNDIRLEYIKRYEEEERYRIYYKGERKRAEIVVSHIARNISFDYFDIDLPYNDIFELAEEYIIPEYEGYKVWRNNVIGNEMYWKWKIFKRKF